MSVIVSGRDLKAKKMRELAEFFSAWQEKNGRPAKLSVFMVGDDPAILSFVKIKRRLAENLGVDFQLFHFSEDVSEDEFLNFLDDENNYADGIVVQLPLPKDFSEEKILSILSPQKDVDLLTERNEKEFFEKEKLDLRKDLVPPVAFAVAEILN